MFFRLYFRLAGEEERGKRAEQRTRRNGEGDGNAAPYPADARVQRRQGSYAQDTLISLTPFCASRY